LNKIKTLNNAFFIKKRIKNVKNVCTSMIYKALKFAYMSFESTAEQRAGNRRSQGVIK
jgi:hypothetical protein